MGNLSGLTIGNTTFPVFASGGGGGMPVRVLLPKSASNSDASGLAMLAWSNGMRYVYCTADPGAKDATGFIPPEYMGNGSVWICDKAAAGSSTLYETSVTGNSTSGAAVTFKSFLGYSVSKTSILFFVNPE